MKLLLVTFLLLSFPIFSQSFGVSSLISNTNKNGLIEGKVFDNEFSSELAFATIAVKNSTIQTETNLDGSFCLNLKPNTYTLVFSFLGYKTIEVKNVQVTSNGLIKCNQRLEALKAAPDISFISNFSKG
jgi:hypothetical protein